MASSTSRWQLLLMADDGRIIPFRRIKGFLLTFLVLLIVLAVVCVGLGWWLVSEMVRHEQTKARLVESESPLVRCLKDRESSAPTPVASETQVEEAELPEKEHVPTEIAKEPSSKDTQSKAPAPAAIPVIALGDALKMAYSDENKTLKARFRIKNNGPRSSPVQGRCVVVLKPDGSEPDAWLMMPNATLVNGEPNGKGGNRFRISNYMDMTVKAVGAMDPSRFSTATVYVFDSSGDKIVEKVYPVSKSAVPASNR